MTDNGFRAPVTSRETWDNHLEVEAGGPKDQRQNLKYAVFYLVVAIVLFLANRVSTHPTDGRNLSSSTSNLGIDLSVDRKIEEDSAGANVSKAATYDVRFRLTNQGNQPIFYPASPDTNRPIGRIVYRVAPQSDWKQLPESAPSPSTQAQLSGKGHVAWIQVPPGGWADGQYEDPGSPAGDHAFELEVKFTTDGEASPLLSRAYAVNTK